MPEIILLDTLIWFWWINEERHRFPASWLARIENAEKVLVSPVSCFEIALANQGGRLTLPVMPMIGCMMRSLPQVSNFCP
jgi:PIN domain nuclease of toxin-antitoxin system